MTSLFGKIWIAKDMLLCAVVLSLRLAVLGCRSRLKREYFATTALLDDAGIQLT